MLSTQVRKYLIPDSNDQIRQQQMREIQVGKLLLLVELTSNKTMSSIMTSCVLMYFHMSSCVLIFR